jgi:hypothetical protein
MRHAHLLITAALVASVAVMGCRNEEKTSANDTSKETSNNVVAGLTLPSGTAIEVSVGTAISSETAHVGDSWSGTVHSVAALDGVNVIAAGNSVGGTITAVKPAQKGDRAMLELGLTSIEVDGRRYNVRGSSEAVIAGSTRARNLGAIAGSAAGGALIGKAATGTGKGAVIGGIIGGGVATGVVAASDGYQVVLKPGTVLVFTTNEALAVRP